MRIVAQHGNWHGAQSYDSSNGSGDWRKMFRHTKLDDGFHAHLAAGARFEGEMGIPSLLEFGNTRVPKDMVPFEKIGKITMADRDGVYVHFYMHDSRFAQILYRTDACLLKIEGFGGIVTPDFTILEGQSRCLQATNTYFNRAVGFYAQTHGVPAIPTIRWGEPSTYGFCFLGVPEGAILSISTHGCMKSERDKESFRNGLAEMIHRLSPTDVLVHGRMPPSVFNEFESRANFHRYPSWFERTHKGKGV